MHHAWTTLAFVSLSSCGAALAQSSDAAASGIAACARIAEPAARLECFDELARQTPANGLSRSEARAAERAQQEVRSSVAALREIQPGRVEVTLANGQVWRQTSSDRYELMIGHEVKVYPSGFGHYFRLSSTVLRGFIQVERIK
jgi:hypothetical protein